MSRETVTVKVPGKLFVAGEYAVVRPGSLALIMAVETEFFVTVSESEEMSCLHTNVGMDDYKFSLCNFDMNRESPWNFVLMTLKKIPISTNKEIKIDIYSELGFGKNKVGYGSSASVVCGVAQAIYEFFDLDISWLDLFERAALAHYTVQGSGSMGDVAAIMFGAVNYYSSIQLSEMKDEVLSYAIKSIEIPWETYIIRTGKSIKTETKLSLNFPDSFYEASDRIIDRLYKHYRKACDNDEKFDFLDFRTLLLQNQQLLIEHLPESYVTDKLAIALNLVNIHPYLVGKISGAGFGENIVVFADNVLNSDMENLRIKLEEYDMRLEKIKIAKSLNYRYKAISAS